MYVFIDLVYHVITQLLGKFVRVRIARLFANLKPQLNLGMMNILIKQGLNFLISSNPADVV